MKNNDDSKTYSIRLEQHKFKPSECPSSADLADYFIKNNPKSNPEIQQHLNDCEACCDTLKALTPMKEFEHELKVGMIEKQHKRYQFRTTSLAASLLVFVGLIFLTIDFFNSEAIYAETTESSVQRGLKQSSQIFPADQAQLFSKPTSFTFKKLDSQNAQIELFNDSLTLIWRSEFSQETSIEIPQIIKNKIHTGQSYLWKINTVSGISQQASPLYSFTLHDKKQNQ